MVHGCWREKNQLSKCCSVRRCLYWDYSNYCLAWNLRGLPLRKCTTDAPTWLSNLLTGLAQVYVPIATRVDDQIPVMVWFHGTSVQLPYQALIWFSSLHNWRRRISSWKYAQCASRIDHGIFVYTSYICFFWVPAGAVWVSGWATSIVSPHVISLTTRQC